MASVYILETSPDLLNAVTDLNGRIVKSNPLFKSYTSHIKPTDITDIIVESDRDTFIAAINRAKQLKPIQQSEYAQTRQKNGANRYIAWSICEINNQLWFVGVQLYDVTSVAAHEHERLKSLVSDAAFIASHQVKQPASSIRGILNIMKSMVEENDELLPLINMMYSSLDQTEEAINELVKRLTRQI